MLVRKVFMVLHHHGMDLRIPSANRPSATNNRRDVSVNDMFAGIMESIQESRDLFKQSMNEYVLWKVLVAYSPVDLRSVLSLIPLFHTLHWLLIQRYLGIHLLNQHQQLPQ